MKQDLIERGEIRKSSRDIVLVKSIISTAESDLKFLKKLDIYDDSTRKIMSNYYDVLRSILEAIFILEGYKIYSHEAFVSLLKEKGEDLIAEKFDRFRKIRNGINYYGKSISIQEVKENIVDITKLIDELKRKYLKDYSK